MKSATVDVKEHRNMKTAIGFLLGLDIGIACGLVDIPLPSFPAFVGAMVMVAVTVWIRTLRTDK